MKEQSHFPEGRRSFLQCICGGSVVILKDDPHNDLVGCRQCGGSGHIQNDEMRPGLVINCTQLRLVHDVDAETG